MLQLIVISQRSSPRLQDSDKDTSLDPSTQTHLDTWLQFLHRSFLHIPPEGRRTCYNRLCCFNRGARMQQEEKKKQVAEISNPFM